MRPRLSHPHKSKPSVFPKMICSLKESNTEQGVYYGSTTVRIWIEGYDADCFNAILNDQILAQFSFRFGFINDNK